MRDTLDRSVPTSRIDVVQAGVLLTGLAAVLAGCAGANKPRPPTPARPAAVTSCAPRPGLAAAPLPGELGVYRARPLTLVVGDDLAQHSGSSGDAIAMVTGAKPVVLSVDPRSPVRAALYYASPRNPQLPPTVTNGLETVRFPVCGERAHRFGGGIAFAGRGCARLNVQPAGRPAITMLLPVGGSLRGCPPARRALELDPAAITLGLSCPKQTNGGCDRVGVAVRMSGHALLPHRSTRRTTRDTEPARTAGRRDMAWLPVERAGRAGIRRSRARHGVLLRSGCCGDDRVRSAERWVRMMRRGRQLSVRTPTAAVLGAAAPCGCAATSGQPPRTFVHNCRNGIGYGGVTRYSQSQALHVGPLALGALGSLTLASLDPARPGQTRFGALEDIAVIRAGAVVTVEVPRSERSYVGLIYDPSKFRDDGAYRVRDLDPAVRFEACKNARFNHGYSQFDGGSSSPAGAASRSTSTSAAIPARSRAACQRSAATEWRGADEYHASGGPGCGLVTGAGGTLSRPRIRFGSGRPVPRAFAIGTAMSQRA